MKILLLVCVVLLVIGVADLPIVYYTLLRIAVTIGSISVIISVFKNGFNFWIIIFVLPGILFNPIVPVYLHNKDAWMIIDLSVAIIFLIKAYTFNSNTIKHE